MVHGEDEWFDDTPWADPAIAAGYKAALGAFLVQFNAIENLVSDILARSFQKLDRKDLYRSSDRFDSKLRTLELIGLALPEMHKPNFKELRDLNGKRNTLAHGHFEQNPYSGEYEVVGQSGKSSEFTEEMIRILEDRALVSWDDLRYCMAMFWFDNE